MRGLQNHEDTPYHPPPLLAHLVDDSSLAMIAGVDRVSSALASLFALRAHPAAYARFEAEVDKFCPPGSGRGRDGERERYGLAQCVHVRPVS